MNQEEITKIIDELLKRKLLIFLSMQPKHESISETSHSDPHILSEWLHTEVVEGGSHKNLDLINDFSGELKQHLSSVNAEREFQRAMGRLMKANLTTGQIVDGDRAPMENFLNQHPSIANFLKDNVASLDEPNKAISDYIEKMKKENPRFKILPQAPSQDPNTILQAQQKLQEARERLLPEIEKRILYSSNDIEKERAQAAKARIKNFQHSTIPSQFDFLTSMDATLRAQHRARIQEKEDRLSTIEEKVQAKQDELRKQSETIAREASIRTEKLKTVLTSLQENNRDYLNQYERNINPKKRNQVSLLFANTDKKYNNADNLDKDITVLLGYPNLEQKNVEALLKKYEKLEKEAMGLLSIPGKVNKILNKARDELSSIDKKPDLKNK